MGRLKPIPKKEEEQLIIPITEHTIRTMAAAGMTQREIAIALGVDHRILRKYTPNGIFSPGQPRKVIDYNALSDAAGIGCTDAELAELMHTSIETHLKKMQTDDQYRMAIKTGREKAKRTLRKLRFDLAQGERDPDTGKWIEKPNTAMIFRLSRELLGERDFNGATAVEKREEITHKFDFTKLSMDELKELKSTISKLKEKTNNGSTKVMEVHNNHESLH